MDVKDIKLGDILKNRYGNMEYVVIGFDNGHPIYRGISGVVDGRLYADISLELYKRTGNILDKRRNQNDNLR